VGPLVSVILIVYNDEAHIAQCIQSVLSQSFKDFELVIVDDASSDRTPDIIDRYRRRDGRIVVIRNRENKQRPYSRNRGILGSSGEIIAFIDSDCIAEHDWLYNLVKAMDSYDVVIGRSISYGYSRWAKALSEFYMDWVRKITRDGDVNGFDTRNCALKRKIFDELELFDPNINFGEDRDLGIRILRRGFKIGFVNNAVVRHHEPEGLQRVFRKSKERVPHHVYLTRKHHLNDFHYIREGKDFTISLGIMALGLVISFFSSLGIYPLAAGFLVFLWSFRSLVRKILEIWGSEIFIGGLGVLLAGDLGNKYGCLLHFLRSVRSSLRGRTAKGSR